MADNVAIRLTSAGFQGEREVLEDLDWAGEATCES